MPRNTLNWNRLCENKRGSAVHFRRFAETHIDCEASVDGTRLFGQPLADRLSVITEADGHGQKVALIVDCEPIARNVFVRSLERLGYRVLEAASVEEAITICRDEREHIDVLIAELLLTDGTGTELAAKIRKHCPNVPVLLTSGTPMEGWSDAHRSRFAELGIHSDFLPKPFQLSALDSKLQHLFSVGSEN